MDTTLFNYLNHAMTNSNILVWLMVFFFAEYLWYFLILIFGTVLFFDKTICWFQKWYWLLTSLLAGGVARLGVTEVVRHFYHHPRPNGIAMFLETSSSFPSGHTIFVFAFATVAYFYNKKIGWWFGILGLVIGLFRVAAGVHWPSDVLGSVFLGILTGLIIQKLCRSCYQCTHPVH